MSSKKLPFVLPSLKAEDELFKVAPEVAKYFRQAAKSPKPSKPLQGNSNASPLSPAALRPLSPGSRHQQQDFDLEDDEEEEKQLKSELAKLKKERTKVLASLAAVKRSHGMSGGNLQAADIEALRADILKRQEIANALYEQNVSLESQVEALTVECQDVERMCPCDDPTVMARIATLQSQLAAVDEEAAELERRNEQYSLLEVRTRKDRLEAEHAQRVARQLSEAVDSDFHALTSCMHETRAAKEETERELGAVVTMFDAVRADWRRKLADRLKEVRDIERRKADESAIEAATLAAAEETRRAERARAEALRKEQQRNSDVRYSTVVPQLEALEAAWSRLRAATGASTAEGIIACWNDLQERASTLRDVLQLAEAREQRAQEALKQLRRQKEDALSGASSHNTTNNDAATIKLELEEAEARKAAAMDKYSSMAKTCTAVQQSLKLIIERCESATALSGGAGALSSSLYGVNRESPLTSFITADNTNVKQTANCSINRASTIQHRRMSAVKLQQVRTRQSVVSSTATSTTNTTSSGSTSVPVSSPLDFRDTTTSTTNTTSDFFPDLPGQVHKAQFLLLDRILKYTQELESNKTADATAHVSDIKALAQKQQVSSVSEQEGRVDADGNDPDDEASSDDDDDDDSDSSSAHEDDTTLIKAKRQLHWADQQQQQEDPTATTTPTATTPLSDLKAELEKKLTWNLMNPTFTQTTATAVPFAVPMVERLVGQYKGSDTHDTATASNPFTLESSDDDEGSVMDRSAVKHRSHKIMHPRKPKKKV